MTKASSNIALIFSSPTSKATSSAAQDDHQMGADSHGLLISFFSTSAKLERIRNGSPRRGFIQPIESLISDSPKNEEI